MKSTPIPACEIDANIEPLRLRRETAVVEMVERYRRSDIDSPNRKIVEKWSPNNSIKQKSVMKVEKELQAKHHLPANRELISQVCSELPPNKQILKPIIKLGLIEEVSKKNSDPVSLYNAGVKTILSYSDEFHQIYTDGSAFKGYYKAGCGARIEYSDKTCDEIFEACGSHCDNYEAEAMALHHVIAKLETSFQSFPEKKANCVIFSDSLSVLETLDELNLSTKAIRDLALQISSFNEKHQVTLYLQWIPSHCGIEGNERADTLAKRGASMLQPERSVSQGTVKQILRSNRTIDWHNQWAQSEKGRVMYRYVPNPNRKDPINSLDRKDQVAIFRLRTNHLQLNAHLSRITKDHNPACPLCDNPEESVHHFLFECPPLQDLRARFLPLNPSRDNTLYSSPNQLQQTSRYYHEAMHRRMSLHL